MQMRLAAVSLLLLAGCALPPRAADDAAQGTAILLLGEQHDAPEHQQLHRRTVEALIARRALAAVALEMADQGRSTTALPADSDENAVRAALHWDDEGWPWAAYGPAVMAAVRAGVPVLGANLPRSQLRQAMADAAFDNRLPANALQAQREAVRQGHCGLLPETQIAPMTRVQVARDVAMAQTLADAAVPGKTVVLLAGAGHVDPEVGVPLHLPPHLPSRSTSWPPQPQKKDYCAQLRGQLESRPRP